MNFLNIKNSGAVGVEVVFFVGVVFFLGFFVLVQIALKGNRVLKEIDETRIRYDGKEMWLILKN